MTDRKRVRWGIIGAGNIARSFFAGAAGSESGEIVAIAARDPSRSNVAGTFPQLAVHAGYPALIENPEIDAVYIALPHSMHAEWAIKAARAGKHVLCEKPIAVSLVEAQAMFAAARSSGTFMAEAFMYRLHPLMLKLLEIINDGVIGDVRHIRSSFGVKIPVLAPDHRLLDPSLGGGAILDLGCYPASVVRMIASSATPSRMVEPSNLKALGTVGPTGVDEMADALLTFPNGIKASISCSFFVRQDNVLQVMGTKGRLEIDDFWFGTGKGGGTKSIRLFRENGDRKDVVVKEERNLYSFQFEACNAAILDRQHELSFPGMSEADTLGNMLLLDRWMEEILTSRPA